MVKADSIVNITQYGETSVKKTSVILDTVWRVLKYRSDMNRRSSFRVKLSFVI